MYSKILCVPYITVILYSMHSYFVGTTDSLCVTVQFVEFIPQSFSDIQRLFSIFSIN